jgi:hypothetical protein
MPDRQQTLRYAEGGMQPVRPGYAACMPGPGDRRAQIGRSVLPVQIGTIPGTQNCLTRFCPLYGLLLRPHEVCCCCKLICWSDPMSIVGLLSRCTCSHVGRWRSADNMASGANVTDCRTRRLQRQCNIVTSGADIARFRQPASGGGLQCGYPVSLTGTHTNPRHWKPWHTWLRIWCA